MLQSKNGVAPNLTLDDGHDSTLLDSRGTLETVGVDAFISILALQSHGTSRCGAGSLLTAEELGLEVHLVERVDGLIVVRLNLT